MELDNTTIEPCEYIKKLRILIENKEYENFNWSVESKGDFIHIKYWIGNDVRNIEQVISIGRFYELFKVAAGVEFILSDKPTTSDDLLKLGFKFKFAVWGNSTYENEKGVSILRTPAGFFAKDSKYIGSTISQLKTWITQNQ